MPVKLNRLQASIDVLFSECHIRILIKLVSTGNLIFSQNFTKSFWINRICEFPYRYAKDRQLLSV